MQWKKARLAAVAAYIIFGYAFIFVARPIVLFLREHNFLRAAVALVLLSVLIGLYRILRKHLSRKSTLIWILFLGGFYSLFFLFIERPEECMHLVQYGLLPPLFMYALNNLGEKLAWRVSLLLSMAFGAADEFIQKLAPDRIFEWRDVHLNVVAAIFGSVFTLFVQRSANVSVNPRL